MKVDHQRQMVGSLPGQCRVNDAGLMHCDRAANESLVQGAHWHPGGKRAEPRWRSSDLREPVVCKRPGGQRVSPIIEVARDDRWLDGRGQKVMMSQQVPHLPVSLALCQA